MLRRQSLRGKYVPAGAASERTVGAGQAIRIMTGAPMPAGADASVMVEDTERLDGGARVRVRRGVEIGSAVRAAGDDVVARHAAGFVDEQDAVSHDRPRRPRQKPGPPRLPA